MIALLYPLVGQRLSRFYHRGYTSHAYRPLKSVVWLCQLDFESNEFE